MFKGLSVYLCIGKYAGFAIKLDGGLRIVLGWVCLAIIPFDVEVLVGEAVKILEGKK